jgi:hypothetical protein
MDIRRGGAASVIADARQHAAPKAWMAVWSEQPADPREERQPSSARLTVQVVRAPSPRPDSRSRVLVQVMQPPALRGIGVLMDEQGVWLRTSPDGPVVAATDALLSAPVAGLGQPLAVFVAGEWQGEARTRSSYDTSLEGEFGDTAILRFKPHYEAGPHTPILKAGVSKRYGTWTLGELDDRKGQPMGKIEWLELRERESIPIAELLRLQPAQGPARTLQRTSHQLGAAVRWQGGAKGLAQLR